MTELPIVCSLTPAALAARRAGLLSDLVRQAESHEELKDGHRLRFTSGDALSLVSRAVSAERQCCRFVRFTITVEPDGGPIVLDLTGPTGTREFLSALVEA